MKKTEVVFNHELDKSILRKISFFRMALLVYILPVIFLIVLGTIEACFGVRVERIDKILESDIAGFVIALYIVFGMFPFIWLLSRYKFYLTNKTLEMMGKEHKWENVYSAKSFESPKSAKESWIVKALQKFNHYGKIKDASFCGVFIGRVCKRDFCFDRFFLYSNDLSNLGTQSIAVRGTSVPVPQTPKSIFEGFLLRTQAIKDFKNIILVKPKKVSLHKIKELQKVEIDTQKLFEIYTNSPQTLGQDLPKEFFSALIEYGKNIDKKITLLITPLGIIAIKKQTSWTGLFSFVIFRSIRTQVIKEWQKYENFINLLELFNLLEKEK